MCDQTEVAYLEGDVVWVKFGPIWWPGVVKDLEKDEEGREILASLKKKPIAVVKFFQEDNYEFVKNLDHIYHYNCRRKDEFIKKGLDKFRNGATHMKKFPADVTTAESLVQGDINIINDPKFYPEKKQNYSEIFGSSKKKNKKELVAHHKSKQEAKSSSPFRPITHQRFINKVLLGESDHKVRTLIQPVTSPEDSISKGIYRCHLCKFETSRVNVIVAHHRLFHSSKNSINWTGSEIKAVRRKPIYKSRKSKTKKLFESPKIESSDDDSFDNKKLTPKTEKAKTPIKSSVSGNSISLLSLKRNTSEDCLEDIKKRPRFTDVLLADWSEEDEEDKKIVESGKEKECEVEEEEEEEEDDDVDDDEDENRKNFSSPFNISKKKDSIGTDSIEEIKDDIKNQSEKMSCFDFDEEEDGFIGMSNANTYGRKIPRVIPVKDKPELGVDLEIGDLFKRKNDSDMEKHEEESIISSINETKSNENESELAKKEDETEKENESEIANERVEKEDKEEKPEKSVKRRRKSLKDQEFKVDEDSLAVRRTRRPGAKKTYLNEVIEKVEEDINALAKSEAPKIMEESDFEVQNTSTRKIKKDDFPTSSSRRKQDLRHQTMEKNKEETIYAEIINNEQKSKCNLDSEKKLRGKSHIVMSTENDDLSLRIDHLLAETSIPNLPDVTANQDLKTDKMSKPEILTSSNTLNFSFDYIPPDSDRCNKSKPEIKSITKMFSNTIKGSENKQEVKDQMTENTSLDLINTSPLKQEIIQTEMKTIQSQNLVEGDFRGSCQTSIISKKSLSSPVIINELIGEQSENEQSLKGKSAMNEESYSAGPGNNKIDIKTGHSDVKEVEGNLSDSTESAGTKSIKTIKLKKDSLPSALLSSAGKLKGQTIIHQKGGTYVILSQPPQLPRQKVTGAKGQGSGKFVILTNQLGEQTIITTSGLQQNKLKIDAQKIIVASTTNSNTTIENTPSTSGVLSVGKSQPVIKMVPDGKGGVMKQLTVSPKKVLVGGTKVLVSGTGTTYSSQGNTIQKIALTSGNTLSGDYRLIENYKGSGKTVLIQGGSSTSTGVLLKSSSGSPRHTIKESIQGTQSILNLKKKPKILMRASPSQNEYVVHSEIATVDSPTYLMKTKGIDGKISAQKIIRRPIINPPKAKSATVSKTFFMSSEQSAQKGESLIIKTNPDATANKIIRLTQKVKESDVKQTKFSQIVQRSPESLTLSQNAMFIASESEEQEVKNEAPQIVQVAQGQSQQPLIQTQVMAMPGPIGTDGNQTYVLVSVDEHGVVQTVDNSLIAYNTGNQTETVFMNSNPNSNVILLNSQTNEDIKPVFSNGSQDILAEALANTNVLEGNISNEMETVIPSILLPPSIPSSVVQETSITLQKPIMTPLEMPSSVAPDTSGLEPPPLPPTPTEEDVLMEEQDTELETPEDVREEQMITVEDSKEEEDSILKNEDSSMDFKRVDAKEQALKADVEHEVDSAAEDNELNYADAKRTDEESIIGYFDQGSKSSEQRFASELPREEFIIENSQEEQESSSFQSMPLLNDEPDTSDDAQGSEPIGDQDFDLQKSRAESEQFSSLLRDQEPPSSTNNEVVTESVFEKPKLILVSTSDTFRPVVQETSPETDVKVPESEMPQEESKVKEVIENKEMQSMPIITDEGSVNSYTVGQTYSDTLSQRRFQEETEVTSTTDEFSNKDNSNV